MIEKTIYVILSCNKERMPEESVVFVDIYEDFEGKDILVFDCPVCNNTHESFRLG